MLDKVGKLITKVFGSKSEKDIKSIQPIVDKIKAYGPEMEKLSDQELKERTEGFRKKFRMLPLMFGLRLKRPKSNLITLRNPILAKTEDLLNY